MCQLFNQSTISGVLSDEWKPLVCVQALQLWQAKWAAREHANALRTRISFRARLSREFSRIPQMESLLAG